jgi:hypothetical protein
MAEPGVSLAGLARTVTSDRPIDLAHTLAPLSRGRGDPCHLITRDGAYWHASRMPTGPVTYRLTQSGPHAVDARAWGPGAVEFLDGLEHMLCLDEDLSGFAPEHPKVADAHRRFPGLRMLRTGLVFEALVPAVLEQKVHTISAPANSSCRASQTCSGRLRLARPTEPRMPRSRPPKRVSKNGYFVAAMDSGCSRNTLVSPA